MNCEKSGPFTPSRSSFDLGRLSLGGLNGGLNGLDAVSGSGILSSMFIRLDLVFASGIEEACGIVFSCFLWP